MDDILFEQRGCIGLITLNRTKALNALSQPMVKAMAGQLTVWRDDSTISAVVVTSASEKAFCAGGDIRAVYDSRENPLYDFFYDEYSLNQAIHRYPKPYISLINGIVMGGGVGISMHGRYVVLGENTLFAMPEVGIGFFPDVGGSYLLSRMTGRAGYYCGMTGARVKRGDCFAFGLGTHAIAGERFDEIIERLSEGEDPEALLDAMHKPVDPESPSETLDELNDLFASDNALDVLAALRASESDFARKTLDSMVEKSPTSVHLTLEQIRRGTDQSFEECMQMEYRMVKRILKDSDFYEGVRATLVDKDKKPHWNPDNFDKVDAAHIKDHFAPLEDQELTFNSQ
ncbi:enoyl-CoA hydratase [Cohaesibacter sp. ES.047]|uniref:enoyl-CoA hydratase/isomerase family protein n=1 Tax=Cohaesibacter sp. ES.047 TaxID=1798205 RepID=UPI000BB6CE2F|nr:enoyl-CoA hydratase/isomerase family protein [Cohaesibacter sp. ES.047]SNY93081.1 enoyl-CoA hydratase [Cohaesibacter sp. ES.047]